MPPTHINPKAPSHTLIEVFPERESVHPETGVESILPTQVTFTGLPLTMETGSALAVEVMAQLAQLPDFDPMALQGAIMEKMMAIGTEA